MCFKDRFVQPDLDSEGFSTQPYRNATTVELDRLLADYDRQRAERPSRMTAAVQAVQPLTPRELAQIGRLVQALRTHKLEQEFLDKHELLHATFDGERGTYSDPRCSSCKPADVVGYAVARTGLDSDTLSLLRDLYQGGKMELRTGVSEHDVRRAVAEIFLHGATSPPYKLPECPRTEQCANEHDMECACIVTGDQS